MAIADDALLQGPDLDEILPASPSPSDGEDEDEEDEENGYRYNAPPRELPKRRFSRPRLNWRPRLQQQQQQQKPWKPSRRSVKQLKQQSRSTSAAAAAEQSTSTVFLREHTFLRRKPATITCPNCLRAVETIVERSNTTATHLSALLLVPLCLCALPYFSKALRNSRHRCPTCGICLGSKFASPREAFVLCLGKRDAATRDSGGGHDETTL